MFSGCVLEKFVNTISYKLLFGIFPEYRTLVQLGTMINFLDFEVKRSKVISMVKDHFVNTMNGWVG